LGLRAIALALRGAPTLQQCWASPAVIDRRYSSKSRKSEIEKMWRDISSSRMSLDFYWRGWNQQLTRKTMKKTKSTPTQIKAKLGLHNVPDTDTVKALMTAYQGLLNNPKFSTPPVDLATYKAGIDQFSALIIDAEDGGKKAKSAKDKQRVVVIKMYTQLGHYVEAACNDDLATFNTSGFIAAVKTKTAAQPLSEAKFSSIDRGPNSGDAVVKPEKQNGAVAFDVRYALEGAGGVLGPWTVVTLTSSKKLTIHGLTLAGIYQFQIRALGKLGYTDWLDTKTFVVA
jgi:hypothetical protein